MFDRVCDGIQAHSEPGNLRDRLALENVIKMREGEMTSTNFNSNNHQSNLGSNESINLQFLCENNLNNS